jgi:hypothetical protein
MSYTIIPEVTVVGEEEPSKIRFAYTTESIINSLELRTHYRAKMIKDSNGESQLDDFAIGTDEKDMVREMLEEGVYEIGTAFFKMAQGVDNSIFFDDTLGDELSEKSSGFEIVNREAYNTNLLPAIDKKIRSCIRYFCLKKWWSAVASPDDVTTNTNEYNMLLKDLKNLTFQLRKPTMT